MQVPFSPPSISEIEIENVIKVLRSGWITTGPKVSEFEKALADYCGVREVFALNSATAGLELVLRWYGIGPGDEVITSPYTFAATANVILHCGATPVFVDVNERDFNLNAGILADKINERTKAIIAVDFAGVPCDYEQIKEVIGQKKNYFSPARKTVQEKVKRILLISDAAHAFGAEYQGKRAGNFADFDVFSFHAVKNLTTGEGGAVAFNEIDGIACEVIRKFFKLSSLHGQNKSALEKQQLAGWFYEIEQPGYKYNLTDMAAAIGLGQLERYKDLLSARKNICEYYEQNLDKTYFTLPQLNFTEKRTSYHLYPLRLKVSAHRDQFVRKMAEKGITCNVHFIPLPLHPLYRNLGYDVNKFPVAQKLFSQEVSLPLFAHMSTAQQEYVVENANEIIKSLME